jgi:hypothetical protein
MLDEMRAAAPRISSYDDWTREMLKLSDEALAAGRKLSAAYYSRGAQFFLDPGDPRFKPALQRFLDNVEAGNGVTADDHHLIPYQQGSCQPTGSPRTDPAASAAPSGCGMGVPPASRRPGRLRLAGRHPMMPSCSDPTGCGTDRTCHLPRKASSEQPRIRRIPGPRAGMLASA